jgi:signal transduction histidine kinase
MNAGIVAPAFIIVFSESWKTIQNPIGAFNRLAVIGIPRVFISDNILIESASEGEVLASIAISNDYFLRSKRTKRLAQLKKSRYDNLMTANPTSPLPPPGTTCPYCNHSLKSETRYCDNCGVDLALAAFLAETALIDSNLPSGTPVAPELLVPRLGEHLISKGILDQVQLEHALSHQQEQAEKKRPILVGQALTELSYLDQATLDQAITEQIVELQDALRQANRRLEQRVRERTAELEHALTKLAELNQLKSNFISNISHELRTPLTHIKGYVELLADGSLGAISKDQSFALDVMHRASDRLEELVNDLLRFSKASQGEFTLHIAPLSLVALLQHAVKQSVDKAREREVDLQTDIPSQLPLVQGDQEKITWVILQLVDNAIKFTGAGGYVLVSAEHGPKGVRIQVNDSGVGIPPERLGEIFEPFHQLDSSSTRQHGGTGLGLALVLRILEAHGALPHVKSEVGKGTKFEFVLPVKKQYPA